jgi:hypothetical protein
MCILFVKVVTELHGKFSAYEDVPGTRFVYPRAGLDVSEKRKICCHRLESNHDISAVQIAT